MTEEILKLIHKTQKTEAEQKKVADYLEKVHNVKQCKPILKEIPLTITPVLKETKRNKSK